LSARPATNRIDAIQSYHEETGTAIAFIFRPQAAAAFYRARLKGLNRENEYRVRFQEDRRLLTMTGAQIMDAGIRVNLPGMWFAEIVFVEPVTGAGN
jgi:hypothetical protein